MEWPLSFILVKYSSRNLRKRLKGTDQIDLNLQVTETISTIYIQSFWIRTNDQEGLLFEQDTSNKMFWEKYVVKFTIAISLTKMFVVVVRMIINYCTSISLDKIIVYLKVRYYTVSKWSQKMFLIVKFSL